MKSGSIPVCRALGHPVDGRKGVQQLAIQLDETWKAVASRFEKNAEVHICNEGKYPSLTISCLEKQEELNISTKTKETNRQDQRVLQGLD